MNTRIAEKLTEASSGQRVVRLSLPVTFVTATPLRVQVARMGRSSLSIPTFSIIIASASCNLPPYHQMPVGLDTTFDTVARKCC
jgi:hypothetical protein